MKAILFIFFLSVFFFSADLLSAQVWQTSVSEGSKLGIRDKYGEAGSYEATFTVRIMDQIAFKADPITVKDDEWGEVFWPFDFKDESGQKLATFPPGYFKVEVSVKGEIVARTEFKMTLEEFEKSVLEYQTQQLMEKQ